MAIPGPVTLMSRVSPAGRPLTDHQAVMLQLPPPTGRIQPAPWKETVGGGGRQLALAVAEVGAGAIQLDVALVGAGVTLEG